MKKSKRPSHKNRNRYIRYKKKGITKPEKKKKCSKCGEGVDIISLSPTKTEEICWNCGWSKTLDGR